MTAKFDYQTFANSLVQQATTYIPDNISEQYKSFLLKQIYDFAIIAGQALVNEQNSLLTPESIQQIIQYISEWTFRKGLELMYSSIPPEHWNSILQTIAGGIFETGKRTMIAGNLDETTVTNIIQGEVESHYTHALNKLKQEGKITDAHVNSIDEAQQKAQDQLAASDNQLQQIRSSQSLGARETKLATIAVILSSLPPEKHASILKTFSPEEINTIKYFMQPENINTKIDPQTTLTLLKNLKSTIAPEEAPTHVAKNIQKLASSTNPTIILSFLSKERPIVQNYVKACIEGKFIRRDFSPYLAKAIFKYLEKQLSTA